MFFSFLLSFWCIHFFSFHFIFPMLFVSNLFSLLPNISNSIHLLTFFLFPPYLQRIISIIFFSFFFFLVLFPGFLYIIGSRPYAPLSPLLFSNSYLCNVFCTGHNISELSSFLEIWNIYRTYSNYEVIIILSYGRNIQRYLLKYK